jgi:hypothetical protein
VPGPTRVSMSLRAGLSTVLPSSFQAVIVLARRGQDKVSRPHGTKSGVMAFL